MENKAKNSNGSYLGFWAIVAIGVGGMVGGGIFAVLGLAVQLAHGGTPVAFGLAGLVALVTTYSYSKLSVTYPSEGGTVEFINQAFKPGFFTGGMNVLLWISYVVMLSLYSYAFGSYASTFFPEAIQTLMKHVCISGVIVIFMFLNVIGSKAVGRAETWIVGIKIVILLFFTVMGFSTIKAANFMPSQWVSTIPLIAGGMIIFVAYEGFELIANTANQVKHRAKTIPRAYFTAVIFVIILYIVIGMITVGNITNLAEVAKYRDYILAEVAKPFLGQFGFVLITIAALLATASAVNATLYGSSRVSYIIAKDGELPNVLEKKVWGKQNMEGLFITAGVTLLVANFFDLSSISTMGSAGFLLIFAFVNISNVMLAKSTNSKKFISLIGAIVCFIALFALVWQTAITMPSNIWVLVIMLGLSFLIEFVYKSITGKSIKTVLDPNLKENQTKNLD
ncbi:MAG: amino acid permease [Candidatus Cloacimonetes bacterium]|nr:amino acid permease [Candidatus Cloacimonadota bacterium]